ncbi:MAG: hypothetical protein GY782_07650 [Gammaproteobacteria bacterium]|nr:hypothetical protein [Gammaproteobacteria bacterium]
MKVAERLQQIVSAQQQTAAAAAIDRDQLYAATQVLAVAPPSAAWIEALEPFGLTAKQLAAVMKFLQINAIALPTEPSHCRHEGHALYTFIDATQQLLRQQERWSAKNQLLEQQLQPHRRDILRAADYFGLLEAITPAPQANLTNPIIVILGGGQRHVEKRIAAVLAALQTQALPWPSHIIAASGYRQLLDEECVGVPLTQRLEQEMIDYCWRQAIAGDKALAQIPFHTVAAALKPQQQRSVTVDSAEALEQYIASQPSLQQQSLIITTCQPFMLRAAAIFLYHLPNAPLWLYSKAANLTETPLFAFQDEIARFLAFIICMI